MFQETFLWVWAVYTPARIHSIGGLKIMVKKGLDFFILKLNEPFQSCYLLLPSAKNIRICYLLWLGFCQSTSFWRIPNQSFFFSDRNSTRYFCALGFWAHKKSNNQILASKKIEGTLILKLAMVKKFWIKKFIKKFA